MTLRTPIGWTVATLADAAIQKNGMFVDGPFGSNLKTSDYTDAGVRLVQLQNIGEGTFNDKNKKYVSLQKASELVRHQALEGDIVIAKMAEPVARACRLPASSDNWIIVADCMRIRVDESRFDADFVQYAINAKHTRSVAEANSTGTTRKRINLSKAKSLPLLHPPLPEQKKIAEVLSSVDETIAATKAVIDQTKQVKKGLLQTLLTKGIGHTKFKQTELGEIPESWEVVKLEDLLADTKTPMRSGPFGSALKKAELVESGIPFLGIDNVHVERFEPTYRRFVTPEKFDELKRYAVFSHDVMITIMGTVGRCCVVPEGVGNMLSSKHVWTMSFDRQKYVPELVCWQLNYAPWVLKEFWRTSQGGVMSAISSKVLRTLLLPKPPLNELEKIADILASKNEAIHATEAKLNQLQILKSGLMSDLLTGRKRVEV